MQKWTEPPEVEVLLATYNGERHLREQIDSILAQDYLKLRVLARDDGSSDATVAILREYAGQLPDRFQLMPKSTGTGSAKFNFMRLLRASTAKYVFFADQDDVWLPRKVSLSVEAMDRLEARVGAELPLMVFTDLRVVDEVLETISESFWRHQGIDPRRIDRFACLLQQNVTTGCTMMLNRRLADLSLRMPQEAAMHDHWIALLASAFGGTEIVPEQTVLYRQHGGNVLGAGEAGGGKLELRWREHAGRKADWEARERQAAGMLQVHGDEISPDRRILLEAYLQAGRSNNRLVRVATMVRHGFFLKRLRSNLSVLWYLWDRDAARRE